MVLQSDKWTNQVYLSLGSNLGDRISLLQEAIEQLNKEAGSVAKISSVYETAPWGNLELLPFYNLVLEFYTNCEPLDLLRKIKHIEAQMGRKVRKGDSYENRVIDIDILWFNNQEFDEPNLIIPHKELEKRRFVLEPFFEIERSLSVSSLNKSIEELLESCKDESKVFKISSL